MKMSEVFKLPSYIDKSVSYKGQWCIYDKRGILICRVPHKEDAKTIRNQFNSHDTQLADIHRLLDGLETIEEWAIIGSDVRASYDCIQKIKKLSHQAYTELREEYKESKDA